MTLSRDERAILAQGRALRARERKTAKLARPKSPKADRGRVRDSGFLAYLRRQPCAVGPSGCDGPIQAAHIRTPRPGESPTGLQRKPNDDRCTPLCASHHRQQHTMRELGFWARYGLDPFDVAARLYAEYQGGQNG